MKKKIACSLDVRAAVLAAAFAVSACATANKPTPASSPAKPAPSVSVAAAPSAPATSATASVAAPTPAAIPMPTGSLKRVGGVVVSSDAAAQTLTIKDNSGHTRTFRIAGGASLTKGGDNSAVQLGDLAAGDRVRLKVGGDVAANVHVMVKPAS